MGLRLKLKRFVSITDDWTFLVNHQGSFWSCPCQGVICVLLLVCFSHVLSACLPNYPQGALMVQNNGSWFSLVSGPSISIQQNVMTAINQLPHDENLSKISTDYLNVMCIRKPFVSNSIEFRSIHFQTTQENKGVGAGMRKQSQQ